jgi:heterodisulfide reductase subunit A
MNTDLAVVGAGIAGISASLVAQEMGGSVTIVEADKKLGGHAAQFCCKATDSCAFCSVCTASELINKALQNRHISLLLESKVTSVSADDGWFSLSVSGRSASRIVRARAIILATGYEPFDPKARSATSFQVHPNIVSAFEIEKSLRMKGAVVRPSDSQSPQKIAFIQCVGSRSRRWGSPECSRVCCPYALRLARRIKWENPASQITIFHMDIQAIRKIAVNTYEEFAKELKFIRGIPSEVAPVSRNLLRVKYEETTSGAVVSEEFDLIIPSTGIIPRSDSAEVSEVFGVKRDSAGFFLSRASSLPHHSSRKGVFLAGASAGPKDIRDSVSSGRAAASAALEWIEKVSR